MSKLGLMMKFGTRERHGRKGSLQSAFVWGESFHAKNSLDIEGKELIQTLGLYPACLLLPWRYRPAANSEQKGVTNIFIWEKSINPGII